MNADPLSEIVELTKAQAVLTGGFCAGGPWAIRFPGRDRIKFFAVVKGECWGHLDGEPAPVRFGAGDVALLLAPRSFVLSSDLRVKPVEAASLFSAVGKTTAKIGTGKDFTHIGGHVLIDPLQRNLLIDVLPSWIHVRADSPHAAFFRWIVEHLVRERADDLPGGQIACAHLTQLLFVQILRTQLMTHADLPAGWLRALSDPRVVPALRLMHGDPARDWRLEELAKACAMSRTTFAFHFKRAAGVAPLTYLTAWRMRRAQLALRDHAAAIADIASSVGYASESAFSNAFKRVTGRSPTTFREETLTRAV